MYIKDDGDELLIIVMYIMFSNNKYHILEWFAEEMKIEFEMSMIGELTFYIGLQILQKPEGIFISQEK